MAKLKRAVKKAGVRKVSKVKTSVAKKKKAAPDYTKLYFGKAGHLFVMSELLLLNWNVAIPEVDIGDDIFVVRDKDGAFIKIQVKSANSKIEGVKFKGTFSTSYKQLTRSGDGQLIYCFALRHKEIWARIVIIERSELWDMYQRVTPSYKTRTTSPESITLNFVFDDIDILWKSENINSYLKKWDYFDHHKPKI